MLINHFHVFPEGTIDKTHPTYGTAQEIMEILNDWGPDAQGVVLAPHTEGASPWDTYIAGREPNGWLYEELQKYPRLHGLVTVNPKDRHAIDILREYIKLGFKGIKMHSVMFRTDYDDPVNDLFYAEAARLEVPIYFHTGPFPNGTARSTMPMTLDRLAYKYPKLKIIIGHMGGYAYFTQTWAMLQTYDNCFAEMAKAVTPDEPYYIPPEDMLRFIRFFGAHRLIYGTDTPWPIGKAKEAVRKDIETILSWPLTDKEKDSILGGTLSHVLGL